MNMSVTEDARLCFVPMSARHIHSPQTGPRLPHRFRPDRNRENLAGRNRSQRIPRKWSCSARTAPPLMTSYHAHCYWSQRSPEHEVPVTWEILLPHRSTSSSRPSPRSPSPSNRNTRSRSNRRVPGARCLSPRGGASICLVVRTPFSATWMYDVRLIPPASDPRARQ